MLLKLHFIIIFNLIILSKGLFKFTNIKCEEYDKPFATIPLCKLKVVRRGVVGFNLIVALHQVPVNNVSMNLDLQKKANGYRPFLYNASADFCHVMSSKNRFNFIGVIINLLGKDTNINHTCPYDCVEFDKSFATIPECELKLVRRGVVAFNLNVTLHQVPVNNVSVNFELLKKSSGYRPFLYNASADFCQVMRHRKKNKYSFIGVVISLMSKDTNINHTCPYDDDIIVRGLVLKNEMFKLLPLPSGDYLVNIRVAAYNHWKARVSVYFTVDEDWKFDRPFATIPECKLKMVGRGVVALNLNVTLHQVPVNNVSINFELLKKANGYRPFLYNISGDFCQAISHKNRYSFVGLVLNLMEKYTNINHTCPYDHNIIVSNLILRDEMFKFLPLPSGDYLFNIRVAAYNDWKACIKMYFAVVE
ncbi:hypothetical protein FF38_03126 [Lucilia cuprina]|uniref:MD-2-related lipid-recognition domain-containing protein n=1 Tax=Lucilia cuprina TaxID=7375 RepID=A0A0L0C668_LUCCU|nr:hypothetical protein FF38_03126 [Lucilia cuprina]